MVTSLITTAQMADIWHFIAVTGGGPLLLLLMVGVFISTLTLLQGTLWPQVANGQGLQGPRSLNVMPLVYHYLPAIRPLSVTNFQEAVVLVGARTRLKPTELHARVVLAKRAFASQALRLAPPSTLLLEARVLLALGLPLVDNAHSLVQLAISKTEARRHALAILGLLGAALRLYALKPVLHSRALLMLWPPHVPIGYQELHAPLRATMALLIMVN